MASARVFSASACSMSSPVRCIASGKARCAGLIARSKSNCARKAGESAMVPATPTIFLPCARAKRATPPGPFPAGFVRRVSLPPSRQGRRLARERRGPPGRPRVQIRWSAFLRRKRLSRSPARRRPPLPGFPGRRDRGRVGLTEPSAPSVAQTTGSFAPLSGDHRLGWLRSGRAAGCRRRRPQ